MTTPTRISRLELEGRHYVVVPLELLEREAPQLLEGLEADELAQRGLIPWEVVRRSINEDISNARAWREYLKLTQQEVADRIGISQSALAQIEKAKRPRKETLQRVAAALGIHYEQLLG
jgi:DNA-binding XRE family transcriptional regulator